jgi:hypothetical protein
MQFSPQSKVPGRLKIYLITDMEGVCGVVDFQDYCSKDGIFRDLGRKLLTEEVNAAVSGFFIGGATEVVVVDGHGGGGWIAPDLLDERAKLHCGSSSCPWDELFDDYDALAFVGQHPKAGTPYGHFSHTQTGECIDFRVNGLSIGEFGQFALVAMQHQVPVIFASGCEALAKEAEELVSGIVTVGVKRGTCPAPNPASKDFTCGMGLAQAGATHLSPVLARSLIKLGACQAAERVRTPGALYSCPDLHGPYSCEAEYRDSSEKITKMFGRFIPARSIKTAEFERLGDAFEEFYRLEWLDPAELKAQA